MPLQRLLLTLTFATVGRTDGRTMRDATGVREETVALKGKSTEGRKTKRKRERGDGVEVKCDKVVLDTLVPPDDEGRTVPAAQTQSGSARPRGKGTGRGKKVHVEVREYGERREAILAAIYSLEYDKRVDAPCDCVRPNDPRSRSWRCVECVDQSPCCEICLRERHKNMPFHKVQHWNGKYFKRGALKDVNLALYLGHDGDPCPELADPEKDGSVMTIGDVTGIHTLRVCECKCRGAGEDQEDRVGQLLHSRLFPATFKNPDSAYTFRLMEHWHLDILQGKKPVYDYWLSLQRRTHVVAKDLTGYRNFMRAGRFWRDLTSRRQSGQGQGIDRFLPESRFPGSIAVICPACPEPGFNLAEDWESKLDDPTEKFKLTKTLAIDATYKPHLKNKRHDPHDRPTNPGGAYFSPFDETKAFEAQFATRNDEAPGPCPGVDGMHRAAGGRDTIYSGLVACVCARHSLFSACSIVNLVKNERFPMLDLSMHNAVGYKPHPRLPFTLSSDRACQYMKYVKERWGAQFPDDSAHLEIIKKAKWRVPKLHVTDHNEECQYRLHFGYCPGAGRTDGEGIERPWPETNATGMITKDANIGHREDILNDTQGDWNHKKVLGMALFLQGKAKEAAKEVKRTKSELEEFASSLGEARVAKWHEDYPSEEGFRDASGEVRSRYRADATKVPRRDAIMKMIEEEEKKRGGVWARGKGPVSMLRRLFEIEDAQVKLRQRVHAKSDCDKAGKAALHKARVDLRVRLTLVRPLQRHHMPSLSDVLQTEEDTSEDIGEEDKPEKEPLHLPSSFSEEERRQFGLEKLAELEMRMRRCCAESELELLKLAIRVFLVDVSGKRTIASGIASNTRANAKLSQDIKRRNKQMARYTLHFDAMVRLGYDQVSDGNFFQPISDTTFQAVKDMSQPNKLGSGKKPDAWFWREGKDVTLINKKTEAQLVALSDEEQRVRYFRMWANWKRWDEEWLILGAEFERTVRHFEKMEAVWIDVAGAAYTAVGNAQQVLDVSVAKYGEDPKWVPMGLKRSLRDAEGRRAYAHKKAGYYAALKGEATEKWKLAGAHDNGRGWNGWVAPPREDCPAPKKARLDYV